MTIRTFSFGVTALLALGTAALTGCERTEPTSTTSTTSAQVNPQGNPGATPLDQGNDMPDLQTTQAIRKSLMADDQLSTAAKNVQIITTTGTVTLRGSVASADERARVETKARASAAGNQIIDQLDVSSTPAQP